MRLISILAFVLALAGTALVGTAMAAPIPSPGISADEVAEVLRGKGHTIEIAKDKDGDPLLKAVDGQTRYSVYFYNRNGQSRFDAIQFGFGFAGIAPARIAQWNKSKRFGRAYLEEDGKVWVEMDMETTRGITTEALEENLDRWLSVLAEFARYVAEK